MRSLTLVMTAAALASVAACKTGTTDTGSQQATGDTTTETPDGTTDGTEGTTGGTTGGTSGGGTGTDIPALVSVNLQNVLNDLSVSLQVDRNSIPVTAQVPIDVAAAVCGVSVDVIAASVASGQGSCTATTTSAQLTQLVQQQISTGGDLGGGDQTMNFF